MPVFGLSVLVTVLYHTTLPIATTAASLASGNRKFLLRTEQQGLGQRALRNASGAPADSKTIDGPDCGNVRKIFPQWEKAKEVGQIAGRSGGAIANSQAAVGGLNAAAAKAREVGKVYGQNDTAAIEAAATKADEVSAAVASAASALEGKLATFKGAVSASEMSGATVTDAQVKELTDLTSALESATRDAQEEVQALLKKVEEVQTEALKSSASTVQLIKNVLGSIVPLLEESPNLVRKAKQAVRDAEAAVTTADKVASGIDPSNATNNQSAVVEASKSDLLSKKQAVADAHPNVTTAISELDTAAATLKTKVEPLKEAEQVAAGGGVVSGVSKAIVAAESAEGDMRVAMQKLRGKAGTLMVRKERLDAKLAELAK